ncbi:hypothetical protein ACWDD9_28775 [Kitasatospora sp. NPDC001119]
MASTEGPVEFAGVVAHVVDHNDGAFAQLHRFLEFAEDRLWERHDNDRARKFAEARKRLEAIGADLTEVVTEMLPPPLGRRHPALTHSRHLLVPPAALDPLLPSRGGSTPGPPPRRHGR